MRVARDATIVGLPAQLARELMRAYGVHERPAGVAADILSADEATAKRVLEAFERAGYLDRRVVGAHNDDWWITTIRGNALAMATFAKPITRATAKRHLSAVVERARGYNAEPGKSLAVAEIAVFGSYLDDSVDRLGDLDLAVTMVRRWEGELYVTQALDLAHASGRSFGTFIEQLQWPRRELYLLLKNRASAISITQEEVRRLTDRFEVVYRIEDDPMAIQPPPDATIER
jgi:predicted nucleotidyltransferase